MIGMNESSQLRALSSRNDRRGKGILVDFGLGQNGPARMAILYCEPEPIENKES